MIQRPLDPYQPSTAGFERSPLAESLARFASAEAYFFRWHDDVEFFYLFPPEIKPEVEGFVSEVMEGELGIHVEGVPLQVMQVKTDHIVWSYVFYDTGLVLTVMYHLTDRSRRALLIQVVEGATIPKEIPTKLSFISKQDPRAGEIQVAYRLLQQTYKMKDHFEGRTI